MDTFDGAFTPREPAILKHERANPLVELCLRFGITANHVTTTAIALLPVLFSLLWLNIFEPALVLMVAIALSDILDGQIARTLEKRFPGTGETALGKILDPLRDKLMVVGSLLLMPWVPNEVTIPIVVIESALMLVRPFQKLVLSRRGMAHVVIPANSYGKWKAWFESIMIIAFLLSVCRPQYLQLVMFVLSAVFGLLSLVTHLINLFRKTKTLH